ESKNRFPKYCPCFAVKIWLLCFSDILIIRVLGQHLVLGIGHWALGIGHWAFGIGHLVLGIGHWALGIGH
ncbi:MAG: hypothetical protein ACYT04_75740, partial [Nostoc sp.]